MLVIQNVFQKIRNTQKKKKKNKQTPNGVYIYNCVIWTLRNYNHLLQYYNVHDLCIHYSELKILRFDLTRKGIIFDNCLFFLQIPVVHCLIGA